MQPINIINGSWKQGVEPKVVNLTGTAFMEEAGAHKFVITAQDESGAEIPFTGTISALFLRADNTTVAIDGTINSGKAEIVLVADCYHVAGRFSVAIYVSDGTDSACVYAAVGNIYRTSSDVVIDSGAEIPTLAQLQAAYQACIEATAQATNAVSYETQTGKTDAQKATARENIGAASEQDVADLKGAIDDVYDGKPITVIDTNKLNPAEIEQNKNIEINGNVKDYNGEDISGYIPIVADKSSVAFTGMNAAGTARVCLPVARILFYNSSKAVISYTDNVSSNTISTVPSGAAYVRYDVSSGYMRDRQPMVEFVDAIGEISATYVQYEEVVERSHGLDYIDEKQQENVERLDEIEPALESVEGQVETNTGDIATLRSDVDDIIGNAKPINTLGTFARGGISSSDGSYSSYYQYRVSTPDIITIHKDYRIGIANGFRLYVATFVNGVLSDKGWKADGYILAQGATVRMMVARTTEDTSEVADVDTFCSKVTVSAVSSMNGYQEQIDENAENIANIDAVIPYGLTWDWWISANCVDAFGSAYIGYVDTDGYAGILRRQPDGVMQYKRLEASVNDDDHNGLATFVLSDGRILAIGSHGHGADNHIICYRSTQPNSIDSMEKLSFDIPQGSTYSYRTTYSQVFSYNGTLFDFMRCTISATGIESVTGYLCLISSDSGDTWTAYQMLTFGDPYIAFAQCTDDEKYLKMVLGINPASGSYTFKGGVIDLSTYKIYDLNNTEIGQMIQLGTGTYDASTIANPADMTDLIAQTADGKKGRLFTTARTAKAKTVFLYATAIDSASSDFTYKVYDDGTVTEIGMSGTPFGNVHYISGSCFGKDVDTIYYAKATTEKADGDHELHKVKISNHAVESDTIIAEASMCILRPLFIGNGEIAAVVGHYNDQKSDGTYNGSFTAWELKPLFVN